jgi:hypothetical protein
MNDRVGEDIHVENNDKTLEFRLGQASASLTPEYTTGVC